MKKLVIIGANEFQNPLILKAKELGYETHVFAWRDGAVGEKNADYFYPISIVEKDEILEKCKEIKPDGILSIGSDLASITVNYVANKLGLPCNSMECTEISTNKYEMRKAFKKAGIPVPGFERVKGIEEINKISYMKYPLIVKPTDRSGSRAITKITKESELEEAINRAVENSFEKESIIEEFIEGNEYSVECITYNGKHNFLAMTKKYTTGAPAFIETGHIEPCMLDEKTIDKVKEMVFKALDALKITNSASHTELKINENGDMRIIEIGARMGGDCIGSHLVQLSTGYDFIKMCIEVAVGEKPCFEISRKPGVALIKFIFNEDDMNVLHKIEKDYPEKIYYKSEMGDVSSHKVIDSGSRFGHYILLFDTLDEAKKFENIFKGENIRIF